MKSYITGKLYIVQENQCPYRFWRDSLEIIRESVPNEIVVYLYAYDRNDHFSFVLTQDGFKAIIRNEAIVCVNDNLTL